MQTDNYTADDTPEEEELLVNPEEIILEAEENDSNEPSTIENYKKKLKKSKVNVKVEPQEQVCTKENLSFCSRL